MLCVGNQVRFVYPMKDIIVGDTGKITNCSYRVIKGMCYEHYTIKLKSGKSKDVAQTNFHRYIDKIHEKQEA